MNSKDYNLFSEAYAAVYSEQVGQHPGKSPDKATRDKYETQSRRGTAPKGVGVPDKKTGYGQLKQDVDLYDLIKGHLMSEGYADDEKAALAIMANMSEEWRRSIVEAVDDIAAPRSQDPLSRLNRTLGKAVNFATGQRHAEVRSKKNGVPGNVLVKQSGPFSTKNVPVKGSFISDDEMKRRGNQSTKPLGRIGRYE